MTAIVVVQLLDQRGPVDGVHPEHGTGFLTNNDNDVGHWFHLQASRLALVSFWASAGWLKNGNFGVNFDNSKRVSAYW